MSIPDADLVTIQDLLELMGDDLVKSRKIPIFVIPDFGELSRVAKAGIQSIQIVKFADSSWLIAHGNPFELRAVSYELFHFHRSDDFLRYHHGWHGQTCLSVSFWHRYKRTDDEN